MSEDHGHINAESLSEYNYNRRHKIKDECAGRYKTTVYRIGLYMSDMDYGGAEEGGWYYQHGHLIADSPRVFTDEDKASTYRSWLQDFVDRLYNNPRGYRADLNSVCCDGRFTVHVFDNDLPEHYPEARPYYE